MEVQEGKQYVTVRMTYEGREKLRRLAALNRRTMAQQMELLIDREWGRIRSETLAARGEGEGVAGVGEGD